MNTQESNTDEPIPVGVWYRLREQAHRDRERHHHNQPKHLIGRIRGTDYRVPVPINRPTPPGHYPFRNNPRGPFLP